MGERQRVSQGDSLIARGLISDEGGGPRRASDGDLPRDLVARGEEARGRDAGGRVALGVERDRLRVGLRLARARWRGERRREVVLLLRAGVAAGRQERRGCEAKGGAELGWGRPGKGEGCETSGALRGLAGGARRSRGGVRAPTVCAGWPRGVW